jgi:hypothetical protein
MFPAGSPASGMLFTKHTSFRYFVRKEARRLFLKRKTQKDFYFFVIAAAVRTTGGSLP